jgi:hypothetical protein
VTSKQIFVLSALAVITFALVTAAIVIEHRSQRPGELVPIEDLERAKHDAVPPHELELVPDPAPDAPPSDEQREHGTESPPAVDGENRGVDQSELRAPDDQHDEQPMSGAPAHTLKGPLRAVSWHEPPADVEHIMRMFWVTPNTTPLEAARATQKMPEGKATLFLWHVDGKVLQHPQDRVRLADGRLTNIRGVWFDHGIDERRMHFERFFQAFHHAGGRLDWLVLDMESNRSMWTYAADTRAEHIQAVLDDPRASRVIADLAYHGIENPTGELIANWGGTRPRWNFGDDLTEKFNEAKAPYVIWNSLAHRMIVESPPTAINWAIGALANIRSGDGEWESFGRNVDPASLYLVEDAIDENPSSRGGRRGFDSSARWGMILGKWPIGMANS